MIVEMPQEEAAGRIEAPIDGRMHSAPCEDAGAAAAAGDDIAAGDDDGANIQAAVDIFEAEGIQARHILVHPFITILPQPWEAPSLTPGQGRRLLEAVAYRPVRVRPRAGRGAAGQMQPLPEPPGQSSSLVHKSPLTGRPRMRVIISANSAIVPMPGCTVLSPCLLVRCPCGRCRNPVAVEIDGAWWSDTPEGRRARRRRDAAYHAARMELVVIPAYEYPQQTWAGILQKKIRSHLRTARQARLA